MKKTTAEGSSAKYMLACQEVVVAYLTLFGPGTLEGRVTEAEQSKTLCDEQANETGNIEGSLGLRLDSCGM